MTIMFHNISFLLSRWEPALNCRSQHAHYRYIQRVRNSWSKKNPPFVFYFKNVCLSRYHYRRHTLWITHITNLLNLVLCATQMFLLSPAILIILCSDICYLCSDYQTLYTLETISYILYETPETSRPNMVLTWRKKRYG